MARPRKEYRAWLKMLARCYDQDDLRYRLYGARGIRVCAAWLPSSGQDGFAAFLADMGLAPSAAHTLERVDNDGSYGPDNCRWATWKEQAQNRRTSVRLTFQNETLTMAQWAERLGVDRRVIWKRLKLGWTLGETLTTALRRAA